MTSYFITKWNKSYFDFENALEKRAVFSRRISSRKVKIGDRLIVMLTKKRRYPLYSRSAFRTIPLY